MAKRTKGELADALDAFNDSPFFQFHRSTAEGDLFSEIVDRLRSMPEGERIEGCEVVNAHRNNNGCLNLVVRIPQGPGPAAQEFLGMLTTLILQHKEDNDG